MLKMYQRCLNAIVDEWELRGKNHVAVMVASHNLDTVRYAVDLMKARGIAPSERVICFGQLFGMCDIVGFFVIKSTNKTPGLLFAGPSRLQCLQVHPLGPCGGSAALFVSPST